MRIKGLDKSKPNIEVVIFPRHDIDDIVIKCKAVISYDRFSKLVAEPILGTALFPDGTRKPTDETRKKFSEDSISYFEMRHGFMLYETLKDNENIEWESVSKDDPISWKNCAKEIDSLPITDAESNRLVAAINRANGMSDALIEEAEQSFLVREASERVDQKSIVSSEAVNSTSGAVVNV
jgi:hypothetical protein